ncbi:MAG: mechanosensitive ion channel family protein, partial [Proteobacteria bacterium]|nr:mechanosensitive ion channel family protein [Pseudomonadota bacterium]
MFEKLDAIHPLLPSVTGATLLLLAALFADLLVRTFVMRAVYAVGARTSATWDDVLIDHRVPGRLVRLVPGVIVFLGAPLVPGLPDAAVQLIRNIAVGYMVLMATMALTALLSAAGTIYSALPIARLRPLKGFVQLLQILVWILGAVLIVAALIDRS